jgi:hypothetical protein
VRTSHPPAVATWLLEKLDGGSTREAVAGDLVEQYRQGRSRAWYWRQVLAAILIGSFRDARVHWVIALRGMAIGWSVLTLFSRFVAPLVFQPIFRVMNDRGWLMSIWRVYYWYPVWAIMCVGSVGTGWIVGRTHRPHPTAVVLAFAGSMALWVLPGLSLDVLNAVREPAVWSFNASVHITSSVVTTLGVLLGGLWSVLSKAEPPAHDQRAATAHRPTES